MKKMIFFLYVVGLLSLIVNPLLAGPRLINQAIGPSVSLAPTAPTVFAVVALSSFRARLTWRDNSNNEIGFKIERSKTSTGGFKQIATVGSNKRKYEDAGLSASTDYFYRIRAYNWAGNSGYTGTARMRTNSFSPIATETGNLHSCAVSSHGEISCWGNNQYGQLGNGTTTNSLRPVDVTTITNAMHVSVGFSHTCALLSSDDIWCWGHNLDGELGDGSTLHSSTPVRVTGVDKPIAVSSGGEHTCALHSSGGISCWGLNNFGQLGNGTTTSSSTPVTVTDISNALAVSAGHLHTCALLSSGGIKCWGRNGSGALGNGSGSDSSRPVIVADISSAIAVSAGGWHTCALLSPGDIKCWGNYLSQDVGGAITESNSLTPVNVADISNAIAVSAGFDHTCVLLSSGGVKCWGENYLGQLGNGSSTLATETPVSVTGISTAVAISASDLTCALLSSGVIKCWGRNDYGQLGNGTTTNALTPVNVEF